MTTPDDHAPVVQPPAASGSEGNENQVSYATYLKTLDEAKTAKARLKELDAAEALRKEKALEAQGEYQKILDARNEENKALTERLTKAERRESDRMKLASVLNAAGGDIDQKWYSLIDFEDVVINESGAVDQMSVARVVEKIKASYPEIIRGAASPKLPNTAPAGGTPGTIAYKDWLNLSSKEMDKWKRNQIID